MRDQPPVEPADPADLFWPGVKAAARPLLLERHPAASDAVLD